MENKNSDWAYGNNLDSWSVFVRDD